MSAVVLCGRALIGEHLRSCRNTASMSACVRHDSEDKLGLHCRRLVSCSPAAWQERQASNPPKCTYGMALTACTDKLAVRAWHGRAATC